ncbi:response regulator [Massilia sp. METH4]|uniref:response regulator n=1 Tax=Massilia sp. METH4 TaxID=3123041 RepID=UPI0030CAC18F
MTLSPPRIFVVDDNHDSADILAEILRFKGFDVHVAYDGTQAIAMANGIPPDVVFLDLGMPGLDGYAVARALRARHGPYVHIVALTAWSDAATLAKVDEAGFDRHLAKPSNLDTIVAIIAASMPARRA